MANEGTTGRMAAMGDIVDKAGDPAEKHGNSVVTRRAVEDAEGNRNIEGPFDTVAALIANLEKD